MPITYNAPTPVVPAPGSFIENQDAAAQAANAFITGEFKASKLTVTQAGFFGAIMAAVLTAARNYNLPDASGNVVLDSIANSFQPLQFFQSGVVMLNDTSVYFENTSVSAATALSAVNPTANRHVQIQDKDGTLALLSDITGGGVTGADNGLNVAAGGVVELGGTLNKLTEIFAIGFEIFIGGAAGGFDFDPATSVAQIFSSDGAFVARNGQLYMQLLDGGGAKTIEMTPTGGITVQDTANSIGFVGTADYSPNYTPFSYVQKLYVDSVAGSVVTRAQGGVTSSTVSEVAIADYVDAATSGVSTYQINFSLVITALVGGSVEPFVSFTDENNNFQTQVLSTTVPLGLGPVVVATIIIRVKFGTQIIIGSTVTGTITYDGYGLISQMM